MALSFHIPSYAWWLVLASAAVYGVAFGLLVRSPGVWPGSRSTRLTFPLLAIGLAAGLYSLEHFTRLEAGPHPFAAEHLVTDLAPLAVALGLLALVVKSWSGWARILALMAGVDSLALLVLPGPPVNHLYQLIAVMALVWGVPGLYVALRERSGGWPGPAVLILGGGIGTFCEFGMVFL